MVVPARGELAFCARGLLVFCIGVFVSQHDVVRRKAGKFRGEAERTVDATRVQLGRG